MKRRGARAAARITTFKKVLGANKVLLPRRKKMDVKQMHDETGSVKDK